MPHPHHQHLESALSRVAKRDGETLAERLAKPRARNDEAVIRARRAHDTELQRAHERTQRRLAESRRTRLHSFGLAGGRRTFPEER